MHWVIAGVKVNEYFPKHADTLIRKYKQLLIINDYGVKDDSRWFDELRYFYKEMMSFQKVRRGFVDPITQEKFVSLIHGEVIDLINTESLDNDFIGTDPIADEVWCADKLTKSGWSARLTKATGDQGIDIVAERDGVKIGIQCKLYSKPVGNKAVQEVFAVIPFHGMEFGAVVTNSTYTLSAKELANSTNILLLHHSQLIDFDILDY